MTLFQSSVPLSPIPDNLIIPQFVLRDDPPFRPVRPRDVPYFIDESSGRTYNYEEVHHRTFGLANALSIGWNIGKNDVVCIFSPNHVDYGSCIWAVHTLGGIVTPANPGYTADELVHQLSTSKTKIIITHPFCLKTARLAAKIYGLPESRVISIQKEGAPPGVPFLDELIEFGASKPESFRAARLKSGEAKSTVAFYSFSSGTSGKPKAVEISHYAVIANVIQMAAHFRVSDPSWPNKLFRPRDVVSGVLPFFHIYGLVVTMHFALFCGLSIVPVPKFSFAEYLKSITRHRVTHLFLVPPQIVLLCKHPAAKGHDFSRVTFCMSGAAPLNGDLMTQITKVFPNAVIGQGYGMTETVASISLLRPDVKIGNLGSAGLLIPGIVAKVVKPNGSLGKEGEQGELVVSGPAMATKYHGNPAATAETFVDGWVRTGDEVIIKDNEVYIIERVKEIIKVKGFQVAPAELEGHLLLHSHVRDACVVGIPDEYSGEVPLAFVVPSQSALTEIKKGKDGAGKVKKDIEKHVSDAKAAYKWLKGGVEFIDEVPKNPTGKILRRYLRDKAKALRQTQHLKVKL